MKTIRSGISVRSVSCFPRVMGALLAVALISGLAVVPAGATGTNYWGNPYFFGGSGTVVVNTTRDGWVRFTATEDMDVSGASLNANSASSPELVVTIQADDGDGFPDGTPLATGTITPSGAGWHDVTFESAASLTADNVYFLVAGTSTPDTSFGWRFINVAGGHPNTTQPFGVTDNAWARGQTTRPAGVPSATAGDSIPYILRTDIGRSVGQPHTGSTFYNLGSATSTLGQRFRFDQDAAGNNLLFQVRLALNIADPAPANPLSVVVLDADFNILTSGSIDLSETDSGTDIFTIGFDQTATLEDGEVYYLGLFSDGSVGSSVRWMGMTTLDNADYRSASFQGADGYAVAWNTQDDYAEATMTQDINRDYYFQLALIPEPGTTLLLGAGALILLSVRRRRKRC